MYKPNWVFGYWRHILKMFHLGTHLLLTSHCIKTLTKRWMEVLTYTYLEQVVLPCPCKFVKILTIWNNASWYILKKIHSLRGSSALKFHAKNRYVTNHEARGAISIFHTGNIIGIHKSGYEFSLNFISFFLSERKPVSFTSVNVGASWSKAIPVESTVSN